MKNIILNTLKNSYQKEDVTNIDLNIKKGINSLKDNFFDLETGGVNYLQIKGSDVFEEYKFITQNLNYFDLSNLKTDESKLSFWINIYNALVVHGIIELGVKNSVNEISHFFEKVSYKIGDYIFSLDDIEHGILRCNVKKHFFSSKPFSSSDYRSNFIVSKLDPRIHFTLVCGSKSCPPIGTYQEEKIHQQLDLAASSFINGEDIFLIKEDFKLKVSKIFKWYGKDFGNKLELIDFISKYRKNSSEKEFLTKNKSSIKLSYFDYDWNLNH
jgi:hypothetical protein